MKEEAVPPFVGSESGAWDKNNVQWQRARAMYASCGVKIEEHEDNIVTVTQTKLHNGHRIFSIKELVARGRDLYPDKSYKIHPVTYTLKVEDITPEWIREQMEQYNVKPRDFIRQLALNSSTVSIAVNGTRPIAPHTKALFYYYFQMRRLSRLLDGENDEEVLQAVRVALQNLKAQRLETPDL